MRRQPRLRGWLTLLFAALIDMRSSPARCASLACTTAAQPATSSYVARSIATFVKRGSRTFDVMPYKLTVWQNAVKLAYGTGAMKRRIIFCTLRSRSSGM